jgi:hypothetical protein
MRTISIAICFLLFLTACATTQPTGQWSRPGTTQDQFDQDKAACRFAVQAANPPGTVQGVGDPFGNIALGLAYNERINQMFDDCMKSKGYKLIPLPPAKETNQAN